MAEFITSEYVSNGIGGQGVQEATEEIPSVLEALQMLSSRLTDMEKFIGFPNDWDPQAIGYSEELFKASGVTREDFENTRDNSFETKRTLFLRLRNIEQIAYVASQNAYQAKINALSAYTLSQSICKWAGMGLQPTRLIGVATGGVTYTQRVESLDATKPDLQSKMATIMYNLAFILSALNIELDKDKLIASGATEANFGS